MKNLYVSAVVLSLICSAPASAEGKLFATNLDGLIQPDGKGMYDQVLKIMGISYEALPAARAEDEMRASSDCMFPIDRRFLKINADFVQSKPIDTIPLHIYSKDGKTQTLADLKGKKLGLRLGLNYGPRVNELQRSGQKVELAPNLLSALKKLEAGRIDVVIEFKVDMDEMAKKNASFKFVASKEPVDTHADAMTCVNTPGNQKLMEDFNSALDKERNAVNKIIGK